VPPYAHLRGGRPHRNISHIDLAAKRLMVLTLTLIYRSVCIHSYTQIAGIYHKCRPFADYNSRKKSYVIFLSFSSRMIFCPKNGFQYIVLAFVLQFAERLSRGLMTA
jgi:hypothetical protein